MSQLTEAIQEIRTSGTEYTSEQTLSQLEILLHMGRETINQFVQDRILRGIRAGFEDMSYRYQTVDSPFQDTFEWIWSFGDTTIEATKFTQWLSSGNSIFHICGKLGSGKSTLSQSMFSLFLSLTKGVLFHPASRARKMEMKESRSIILILIVKHLYNHKKTKTELNKWMRKSN